MTSTASITLDSRSLFTFSSDSWSHTKREENEEISLKPPKFPPTNRIVTWNVDFMARGAGLRLQPLFGYLEEISETELIDIIFLQEVSKTACAALRDFPWVQDNWALTNLDHSVWNGMYGTMTLINRQSPWFLAHVKTERKPYQQTIMDRDQLCSEFEFADGFKICLINTHLESLAIPPNKRPGQLTACKASLDRVGAGIVLGDFNMILDEDRSLIEDHGLVDAWAKLYPDKLGYTWGIQRKEMYPANRLDRIAMLNLEPLKMNVLECGKIWVGGQEVLWSDHCGLSCEFGDVVHTAN